MIPPPSVARKFRQGEADRVAPIGDVNLENAFVLISPESRYVRC